MLSGWTKHGESNMLPVQGQKFVRTTLWVTEDYSLKETVELMEFTGFFSGECRPCSVEDCRWYAFREVANRLHELVERHEFPVALNPNKPRWGDWTMRVFRPLGESKEFDLSRVQKLQ